MASSVCALRSPLSRRLCRSSPTGLLSRPPPPRPVFCPCLRPGWAVSSLRSQRRKPFLERRRMGTGAVSEEEALASESEAAETGQEVAAPQAGPPVSVPVSPSDMLTMFFKAEGTMDEPAISSVTKGLEGLEGVSDLKVQVLEGIASVELTKQTTVQATGVASNLVEIIQGSGFKLQTLNLSFEDEEDAIN
uniref:Solute carrier family 12 member 2 n=1 Tax=Anthurium amnicola TaxID=1678845 RepID=A0A1D1ZCA0_9ARAE